jgi:hypothetical protein
MSIAGGLPCLPQAGKAGFSMRSGQVANRHQKALGRRTNPASGRQAPLEQVAQSWALFAYSAARNMITSTHLLMLNYERTQSNPPKAG